MNLSTHQQFQEITGISSDIESYNWLERANNDLELAVQMFFASNTEVSASSIETTGGAIKRKHHGMYDEEGNRLVPDAVKSMRLLDDNSEDDYHSLASALYNYMGGYAIPSAKVVETAFSASGFICYE